MGSEATSSTGRALMDLPVLPFAPSWVDRLLGWINQLPIPAWLFYLVLLGIIVLIENASRWLDRSAPIGALDAPFTFLAVFPVLNLAAIHYLDGTAGRAFDSFRQALGRTDADAARLRYELTHLPPRNAWIAAGIGLLFFLAVLPFESDIRRVTGSGIFLLTSLVVTAAGFVMTVEFLYHTLRQLRWVSRIHVLAENLDLFNFAPLYSFSALTARTGIFIALLVWYDLAANPETLVNPLLVGLNAVLLLFCAACFVLPLHGMHLRILVEKGRLELDANQRVMVIVEHLYGQVDGLDLHDADAVNKTLSSLVATRELIAKIPTWPWRPETFTAFFTTLTLPVLVFLIQKFLQTLFGFK